MNLRQMEVFRAVMITGSTTDAAKLLHVSQPGISRLIQHLELQLGVALFERRKRHLVATPEALALHGEIERVYRGVKQVQDLAVSLKFGGHSTLRVLSSANTSLKLVPRAISRLVSKFPDTRVAFEANATRDIVAKLVAEEVDVAVCSAPIEHPGLNVQQIGSWRLLYAIRKDHPLATKASVDIADALKERLVAYSADAPQSQVIDGWLDKYRLERNVVVDVRSCYVACSLVGAGLGIAFVDDLSAQAHGEHDVVFRPVSRAPRFPICVVTNANRPLSRVGIAFRDLVRKELALLNQK